MDKKIAYITDIHLDEPFPIEQGVDARKNWSIILDDLSSKGIDKIVFGGDIGEKSANKWFFETLHDLTLDISLGNHDAYNEVIKHYNLEESKKQNELYYSQEQDYHKCIFLDSSTEAISEKQFDWFKKELSTDKSIVLFVHHPILAIEAEVDKRFALNGRKRIKMELLNIENDVTIFSGHYHFEDERSNGNIRQFVTPACSYQVEKNPNEIKINNETFGYRIINLNKKEIYTELVIFTSKEI